MLVVNVPYAVFNDGGIAIAKFVILVYKVLLISLISFGGIFLRFKECRQLAGLVCLGEGTLCEQSALNLRVAQVLVALMIIWRTFIFSFLSISTSSIT